MNNKLKRIAAMLGIILLVGLSVASLIIAFLDFEGKSQVLFSCLAAAVLLPIFIWIMIWMFGIMSKRKTIASFRSEEMDKTMEMADRIRDSQLSDDDSLASEESDTSPNS